MVIWGGPHCINAPELSLRFADGVCFAEGDESAVIFANAMEEGKDYLNTPNMAFTGNETTGNGSGNNILKNKTIPPIHELDSLPYPDWDIKDHFILNHGLSRVTKEDVLKYESDVLFPGPAYIILTSRGCPNICSYCYNSQLASVYDRYPIRFRSVDHFIGELEYVIEQFVFFSMWALPTTISS